jgi:hypothetical protein
MFVDDVLKRAACLKPGLGGLHHIGKQMLLHLLRAVRVGQVAHVEGQPRRGLLQVGGVVAHVLWFLRHEVVEVVAEAGQIAERRGVTRQVAVQ